jgi:hypothetical protein
VATLDTLGDFQGFAGDETPKVANPLKGHVSESTADERRHDVFEERSAVLDSMPVSPRRGRGTRRRGAVSGITGLS